ncbi:protein phosphatase, partial [Streptomyces sp. NPDC058286]
MNGRLALLESVEAGIAESEVLRLALLHAVAELGGLGGAVHLRGPMSALRLVASMGLPPSDARSWEIVDQEGMEAPALAVRRGRRTWAPHPQPSDGDTRCVRWSGAGLAAVPLLGAD